MEGVAQTDWRAHRPSLLERGWWCAQPQRWAGTDDLGGSEGQTGRCEWAGTAAVAPQVSPPQRAHFSPSLRSGPGQCCCLHLVPSFLFRSFPSSPVDLSRTHKAGGVCLCSSPCGPQSQKNRCRWVSQLQFGDATM